MEFDTVGQALKCSYCGSERAIENDIQKVSVEYDLNFADEENVSLQDWGTEKQLIECGSCGGEMLLDGRQTAAVCGFCGSKGASSGQSWHYARNLSFRFICPDQAAQAFQVWRKKKWFIPNNFKRSSVI